MSYADELFDRRVRQHEIKQIKRNLVDPHKFEFQRKHVKAAYGMDNPRDSITTERVEEAIKVHHQGDELGVNWEFLDEVPRTKALRRINLFLQKEQIDSGVVTIADLPTRAKVQGAHLRTSSLPP